MDFMGEAIKRKMAALHGAKMGDEHAQPPMAPNDGDEAQEQNQDMTDHAPIVADGSPEHRGALHDSSGADEGSDHEDHGQGHDPKAGHRDKHFIQKAIKHPGSLHTDLGVPQGQKIPPGKLESAAHEGGKVGEKARFAEMLEGLHHGGVHKPLTLHERAARLKIGK